MRKYLVLVAIALGISVGGLLAATQSAQADNMTFRMRSFSQHAVHVKFFSSNRNWQWPSSTTVYTIRDYEVHSFKISCVNGEKVCYGAAVSGNYNRYWGRSIDGKKGCQNCCYTCNGNVTQINNLNER